MQWIIHTKDTSLDGDTKDHLQRRLLFALSRFEPKIVKINVYLIDHNGPKGGIDKSCQIIVQLRGITDVVVKSTDADWNLCIDRATSRVAMHVRRVLARVREHHRRPV
jgi:putative sigma-54 modulation protein